ncbi:hypothetical protein [Catellatospora methionotrophica]|uniref:hypothetical protein n=1 Tax=Catellatospora methionotrophica TaxID=121620 RepID=UPI0033EED2EA
MTTAEPLSDFLMLPPRLDNTAELLAASARRRGLAVEQLAGPAVPDRLRRAPGGHLYGGPAFAAAVAAELDLVLLEPADDWLARLPYEYTRREITLTTLGEARWSRTPMFVKQPRDKTLPAGVYADGSRLPGNHGLSADTSVLVSDIERSYSSGEVVTPRPSSVAREDGVRGVPVPAGGDRGGVVAFADRRAR